MLVHHEKGPLVCGRNNWDIKLILFVIFFILATHSPVFSFLISLFFISPCHCLLFFRAYFPFRHPQVWQCSISCRKITCQIESERDRERFEGKRCKCRRGREIERGDSFYRHVCSAIRQTAKEICRPLWVPELWQTLRQGIDEGTFLPLSVSLWRCLKANSEVEYQQWLYLSQALYWGNFFSKTKKEKHCQPSFDILKDNKPLLFPHSSTTCSLWYLLLGLTWSTWSAQTLRLRSKYADASTCEQQQEKSMACPCCKTFPPDSAFTLKKIKLCGNNFHSEITSKFYNKLQCDSKQHTELNVKLWSRMA